MKFKKRQIYICKENVVLQQTARVHGAGGVRLHPESDPDGEEEGRRRQEDAQQERQGRRGRQSGDSGFPGDLLNFADGFSLFPLFNRQNYPFYLSFSLSAFLSFFPAHPREQYFFFAPRPQARGAERRLDAFRTGRRFKPGFVKNRIKVLPVILSFLMSLFMVQ